MKAKAVPLITEVYTLSIIVLYEGLLHSNQILIELDKNVLIWNALINFASTIREYDEGVTADEIDKAKIEKFWSGKGYMVYISEG